MAFCKNFGIQTSLATEAYALLHGLQLAKRLSYIKLQIEIDSKVLVNILQGIYICPWRIYYAIRQIIFLLDSFEYKIAHI